MAGHTCRVCESCEFRLEGTGAREHNVNLPSLPFHLSGRGDEVGGPLIRNQFAGEERDRSVVRNAQAIAQGGTSGGARSNYKPFCINRMRRKEQPLLWIPIMYPVGA